MPAKMNGRARDRKKAAKCDLKYEIRFKAFTPALCLRYLADM